MRLPSSLYSSIGPSVVTLAFVAGMLAPPASVRGGTISGTGTAIGRIINSPTRQHIQANFRGTGVHRPSGKNGSVNGGISSLPGQRSPLPTILGAYRTLARAHVRYSGGSNSVAQQVVVRVGRRSIVIAGLGRIRLNRALNPVKRGSQSFRGTGNVTVRGV